MVADRVGMWWPTEWVCRGCGVTDRVHGYVVGVGWPTEWVCGGGRVADRVGMWWGWGGRLSGYVVGMGWLK